MVKKPYTKPGITQEYDDPALEKIFQVSQKFQEQYENIQKDETGAFRERYFHSELGQIIDEFVSFDHLGKAKIISKGEDIFWLSITSRDLSRINTEGGHFAGDLLLRETVNSVNSTVSGYGKRDIRLFHMYGADFFIGLKGNLTEMKEIETTLQNANLHIKGTSAPGKISVSRVGLVEAIEFYNQFLEIDENTDRHADDPKKLLAGQIVKLLNFRKEFEKLVDVSEDFKLLISTDPKNVRNHQEHFKKYIEYQFRGSGLNKIEGFVEDKETIQAQCFQLAYERVFEEGEIPLRIWGLLQNRISNFADLSKEAQTGVKKSPFIEEVDMSANEIRKQYDLEITEFVTRKRLFLTQLEEILNKFDPKNSTMSHLVNTANKLLKIIQEDRELMDIIDDLLNPIIQSLSRAQEIINRKPGEEQAADWTISLHKNRLGGFVDMSSEILKNMQSRYDALTGLPNKTEFEREIGNWFEEHDGKEFGLVSIDLGFLKYFNSAGNREAGDLAIQKAGWILDNAQQTLEKEGIPIKVFRTGGDEFQILVEGKSANLATVINTIEVINSQINQNTGKPNGLVPPTPLAKRIYQQQMLEFDYGSAHVDNAKKILGEIIDFDESTRPFSTTECEVFEKGLDDQELSGEEKRLYFETLSQIQTRMADRIIETNKKVSRFELLMEKFSELIGNESVQSLPDDFSGEIPEEPAYLEWKKLDVLTGFSGKALEGRGLLSLYNIYQIGIEKGYNFSRLTNKQKDELIEIFYGAVDTRPEENRIMDLVELFRQKKDLSST